MKKTLLKNNEEEKKGIRNRLQKKRKKKQGKTQTITKLFTDFCWSHKMQERQVTTGA